MFAAQKWVVCEESGRWTAALRVAFARSPNSQSTLRLYEVRTIEQLSAHLDEHGCDLALVEVGRQNLARLLEMMTHRGPGAAQFVALLGDVDLTWSAASANTRESRTQEIADSLWEAGAVEIVESPRQMGRLLAIHKRLAVAQGSILVDLVESRSFAEWAWSTLPWQDP